MYACIRMTGSFCHVVGVVLSFTAARTEATLVSRTQKCAMQYICIDVKKHTTDYPSIVFLISCLVVLRILIMCMAH